MWQALVRTTAGSTLRLHPGQTAETPELQATFQVVGDRYQLKLWPRRPLVLAEVSASIPMPYQPHDQLFGNGFQSWSESRYYPLGECPPPLRRLAYPLMGHYGDYHIQGLPRGSGRLASWSWTLVQRTGQPHRMWASLDEAAGFTAFVHNPRNGTLNLWRDCAGLHLHQPWTALHWLETAGTESACYASWFAALGLAPPTAPAPALGWTSWYQHYTHITEDIILQNLAAYQAHNQPIQFFQLDDGWQPAVGDWTEVRTQAFPCGLAPVAEAIRHTGAIPGLWLAPWVADQRSQLPRQHPHWLLRDARGRPRWAGYSPPWGGRFYALDSTQPGLHDYLAGVFDQVIHTWGFGLLKLDFLYAACLYPTPTHTRGRLMYEALLKLREWAGSAYLLGCGVPLASGFGLLDYCRIGADLHLGWEHGLLRWLHNRERVSTLVALRSVLGRWALHGRAWHNDPDVFLLRDDNLRLTPTQRQTVLRVNTLLGGLLFTSDHLDQYGPWQWAQWQWLQTWQHRRAKAVDRLAPDVYALRGEDWTCYVNLTAQPWLQQGLDPVEAYGTLVVG